MDGLVRVDVSGKPLPSLEPFRGLPIDLLAAAGTLVADLEPLRGMHLQGLNLFNCTKVADLTPLRGMLLRKLLASNTLVRDLSPLAGMPLNVLSIGGANVTDLTPLGGMPLVELFVPGNPNLKDCSPLKRHAARETPVVNLAALRGLPLEILSLQRTSITDLSAVQGAPLKEINLRGCNKLTDFSPVLTLSRLEWLTCDVLHRELASLRQSKTLQTIDADAYPGEGAKGPRPIGEFWAAYDAQQAAGAK